jgi:CRP/FNR family transcriptional regulator, cyclic AMP receptor protein
MEETKKINSHLSGFPSGASLGGKVSRYRGKQNIYSQGAPAYTLFYIQEGGVRLTTRSKDQAPAVTAILGAHDFFGELCLAGYPLRMSTAVALTASSIRTIKKTKMLEFSRGLPLVEREKLPRPSVRTADVVGGTTPRTCPSAPRTLG